LRDGYERLANARLRSTQIQQALRDIQAAVAAAERAAERRPGGITSETLAHTWVASGNILWLTGDLQTAASRYEKAIATLELLYTAQPENLETAAELGRAYRRLADLLANPSHFHFSQPERAMPLLEKSLAIAHRLQAREPESAPARTEIAVILRRMGAALRGSDPVKSAEYYRQAIEIAEALHNTQKQDFNYLRDLANSRLGLGIALHNQRQIVAAHDQLAAALKIQNSLADASPDRVELREDTFDTYLALGQVLLDARNFPAAGRMLKLAMDSAEGLVSRGNGSLYAERCLAFASEAMGRYELALSNTPGASAWYNKALGIWRRWRGAKLAVPYSADRERELLEAMRKNKIAAI
jgi:tetratricopeptide (TPR) repeat protein